MIRFFWCHEVHCPNYGRARRLDAAATHCEICRTPLSVASPDENRPVSAAVLAFDGKGDE
jgi:hypothetical protein